MQGKDLEYQADQAIQYMLKTGSSIEKWFQTKGFLKEDEEYIRERIGCMQYEHQS